MDEKRIAELKQREELFIDAYGYAAAVIEHRAPGSNPAHAYPFPQLTNLIDWLKEELGRKDEEIAALRTALDLMRDGRDK